MLNVGTFIPKDCFIHRHTCEVDADRSVDVATFKVGNTFILGVKVKGRLSLNPPPLLVSIETAMAICAVLEAAINEVGVE